MHHALPKVVVMLLAFASTARADVPPYPSSFRTQEIPTRGATIHVRVGGSGPAVLLLHGFGDTGDMWAPVAADLVRDHRVVVPDLRGMGLSSKPEGGYDKKTQALDVVDVLDALKIQKVELVTHDIGNMVGYAFVAQFPARVTRWVKTMARWASSARRSRGRPACARYAGEATRKRELRARRLATSPLDRSVPCRMTAS